MRNHRYLADGDITVMDPPDEEDPELQPDQAPMQELDGYPQPGFIDDVQQADMAPPPDYLEAPPTAYAPPPQSPIRIALPPPPRMAAQRLEKLIGEAPVKSHPNWMQRVGAGALGAAAGWSNAAGRARPIDIKEATEGILHPGYQGKLAEWQSRVAPAEIAAKLESNRINQDAQQHNLESQAELRHAQSQAAIDHGAYWKHRAETEANRFHINAKGQVVDMKTGEVKNGPPTFNDKYQQAIANGRSKDEAWSYASGQKLTVDKPPAKSAPTASERVAMMAAGIDPDGDQPPPGDPRWAKVHGFLRPTKEPDELAQEMRAERLSKLKNDELDNIGKRKTDGENRILAQRNQQLASLTSAGRNLDEKTKASEAIRINNEAAAQLQNVQNEYVQQGRRRGVQVDDYDVKAGPDGNIQYAPRVAKPPQQKMEASTVVTPQQPKAPAAPQAPLRRYNKAGDAVEWNGKQWLPVKRQ